MVTPSLIPKNPGERVKTDKRDAMKLAKMLKAEELTPINVPELKHEAIRNDHPRKLMSYIGIVPCEYSSGCKRHIWPIKSVAKVELDASLLKVRTHASMPLISPLICKHDKKVYQSWLLISHGKQS